MFGPNTQNVDNSASRQRMVLHEGPEQDSGSSPVVGTGVADLSRLASSSNIGASYNAPVHVAAMQGMQQTHGNRAVQRATSTSSPGARIAVQRVLQHSNLGGGPGAQGAGSIHVQREEEGGHGAEEDESWYKSMGSGLLGGGITFGGDMISHVLEHGTDAMEGMGEAAGGLGGLALGPLALIKGLHEGGTKGGIEAVSGGLETLGGFGKIVGAGLEEAELAGGAEVAAAGGAMGAGGAVLGAGLAGWEVGSALDEGANALGQWITGDKKGDYSLHHGLAKHVLPHILPPAQDIRDGWEVFRGRGTEAQQENAEKREGEVEYEHLRDARMDREQKARDEQEMAEIHSQMEHPHVGGTMLGTPGDALSGSAIAAQFMPHEVDEDGVPLPPVSMALPEPQHKRR